MAIRVLLVDDQMLTRQGLKAVLQAERDIEIVGEAKNGRDALQKAVALHPDVVLMDIMMPEGDGITATREITQRCPNTRVLIFTVYADQKLLRQAAAAGAIGYELKDISPANLGNAIRAVHSGKTAINPTIVRQIVESFVSNGQTPLTATRENALTQREIEILVKVAQGLSDKEIAAKLFLSESTVKSHLRAIYSKTRLRNRAQAAAFAVQTGLLKSS